MERHPGDVRHARLRIRVAATPANLPTIRRELNGLLDTLNLPPGRASDIRLAVTEACANAALHAYPGRARGNVLITAETSPDLLEVTVRDYGRGLRPDTPPENIGLGLPLIQTLADAVAILDADPGVTVRMRFRL